MPLPAASAPTPLTVLLLAWDEATPAVRAVIEAMQAPATNLPGALVIVPAASGSAAVEVAEPVAPVAIVPELAVFPALIAPELVAPLPPAAPATLEAAAIQAEPPIPHLTVSTPPLPPGLPQLPGYPDAPTASIAPAVRILRLGSFSLSALSAQAGQPLPGPVWTGESALPAPPYLGATVGLVLNDAPTPAMPASTATSQQEPAAPVSVRTGGPAASAAPANAAGLQTGEAVTAPLLIPGHLSAPPFFLSPTEEPDAPLDFDFPTTSPVATAESTPESATWAAALAALQPPPAVEALAETSVAVPNEKPSVTEPAPSHAVLGLPASLPKAPDLNFQIIQYARFAVPVALAEQPFGVLYAPSWPTWLAAQELRQRTGRPLVLHLSELAAGTESADTAIGWVAELQRQALRRADLVLVETHALASRLRRELSLPAHAVRVVPAADTARIARALRRVQK